MGVLDGVSSRVSLAERFPRLWTLWAAARPSQVALILLVYALGVGIATAGTPTSEGVSPIPSPTLELLGPVLSGAVV